MWSKDLRCQVRRTLSRVWDKEFKTTFPKSKLLDNASKGFPRSTSLMENDIKNGHFRKLAQNSSRQDYGKKISRELPNDGNDSPSKN